MFLLQSNMNLSNAISVYIVITCISLLAVNVTALSEENKTDLSSLTHDSTTLKPLSRHKRYVAFPEGSSFSVSSHSVIDAVKRIILILYMNR